MATERSYNVVPPVLLTSNGSAEGVLQVTDTAGFYIQMQATLANNLGDKLTVYIKRVVNSTTLWVGATKGGMDHNVDVSAFTIATASNISAQEQNKQTVPMEARLLSTFENDPVDAWRTIPVDSYGNHYTPANPFPVTPFSQFFSSLTLGALGMPTLFAQCLTDVTYNQVISSIVGNVETLNILNNGVSVDSIVITYNPGGWSWLCGGPISSSYLLLETSFKIRLENGTGAVLLE